MNYNHNPETLHKEIYKKTTRKLAFSEDRDFDSLCFELREKFSEVLGMHEMPDATAVPELNITTRDEYEDFTDIVFNFESEPGYFAPCHLLLPKKGKAPFPVIVCLQGHNSGMHLSLNRLIYEGDEETILEKPAGFRAYGIQTISMGYAALLLEQRGFGRSKNSNGAYPDCFGPSTQALMLGRTLAGERVYDVIRAINALTLFPEVDMDKIGCMGNSSGGTTTYYAACLDERIKIAMPTCSICTLYGSFFTFPFMQILQDADPSWSCVCCYVPGMLKWFENSDLAALIAPRKLLIVNGRDDEYFPIEDSKVCFEEIKKIYRYFGCEDNCRFFTGPEGHRFYPDESWPVFKEMSGF